MASFVFAQVTKIDGDHSGRMFKLMRTLVAVAAVVGMRLMFSQLKVEDFEFLLLLFSFLPTAKNVSKLC